jgi:hypothetical protein
MKRTETYTIDIETNNLLANMLDYSSFPYKLNEDARLWVVAITNAFTGETKKAVKEEITEKWLKESLADCKVLVAHNGIKFDYIALKLFGVLDYKIGYLDEPDTLFGEDCFLIDSLILSRLLNPDRFGGHSLKAWGHRIGNFKDDFRQQCIDAGIIDKGAEKGDEFKVFSDLMISYCEQDTIVNVDIYKKLLGELKGHDWKRAIKVEHKLADLAIRRESLGFWFNKDLALECLEDLTKKMEDLTNKVNPILPPKPMNKGEIKDHTPPKTQVKKDGSLSSYMQNFIGKTNGKRTQVGEDWFVTYGEKTFKIPFTEPIKTHVEGTIDDLDHVKQTLIDVYNWVPSEWRERDLTKDSKKISLSYEKRIQALERWYKETMEGKYKKLRLKELGIPPKQIIPKLSEKLKKDFPVRVPTSPPIRVGVEKDLCPNLIKLGKDVEFASDFALYLTYKHRKSSIAGGDIEEMDFDEEAPNTGFLSIYREVDGRVPTASIEIGAVTNRYTHIGVANIARATSEYGKEMRSLFGCGPDAVFFGFDYASLEARIMAHYVYRYPQGVELGRQFIAEKPDDWHCYSEDTEILTEIGWKTFNKIGDLKVAQWEENSNISFVKPNEVIWEDYNGNLILSENNAMSQLVTPNHRVLTINKKNKKFSVVRADELNNFKTADTRVPLVGNLYGKEFYVEPDFVKLLVAIQADAHLEKNCSAIKFSFTKEFKVKRLVDILKALNITFSLMGNERKGRTEFTIRLNASEETKEIRSWLGKNKEFLYNILNLSEKNRQVFLNELQYWDGYKKGKNIVFENKCEKSVDVVQSVAHTTGLKATKTKFNKTTQFGSYVSCRCFISIVTTPWAGLTTTTEEVIPYEGKIGCVSVPSGFVLVRRNGRAFISGNTSQANAMGIDRTDAKSVDYGLIYGAQIKKIMKMLNVDEKRATEIYNMFWDNSPALKALRDAVTEYWENTNKKFVLGLDGRKITVRSKHALLNSLFQSAGIIYAKYISVLMMQKLEKEGYCIDPFIGKPDVCSMIEYHDEQDMYCNPDLFSFKKFGTKEEAEVFVKEWEGEQISAIGESHKGFYIALPNPVSKAIDKSMREVENVFKINVPMGFEYMLGKNWYQCH